MPPEQKPQNSQNNSIPVGEGLDSPGLAGMIETESNQTALENQALDALSFARADEASLEPSVTTLAETTPLTAEDVPKPTAKYFPQMVRVGVAALVVLLVGLGFFGGKKALDYQHNLAKQGSIATNYATNSSPLNDLANQAASGLSVVTDSSARLTVNGTLDVNGSLVINQSGTPTKPVKGQIYYSKTDNKLYFYNGLTFIDITYASTAPTSVTSVQGQAGAVTFTAGNGIAINGTTISSTVPGGVKSLFSGSANLSISSDGNGGYTITDANGGVGVELQNSTPGSPQTGNINITGTVIAGSFQGDGSGLTNLNASNLASGTVSDARLSTNVTLAGNTFNGVNQLVQLDSSGFLPVLNGSALTSLNASNVASGTLNDARLSANVTLQGNIFNGANQLLKLNPSGDLPALSGINLTNLNASEVTAGTLPDARLSANVTLMGNTFNGANQLLQLTNLGYLPVVNGSNLTSLNASSLSSGTVADARLSANVALLNGNQTFSGSNTFSSAINANTLTPSAALTLGAAAQSFTLQGNGSSTITSTKSGFTTTVGFAGTPIGNVVYNFDNSVTAGTYTICTTYGNCSGTGGGVTTVGGTTNKLARFTGAQTIGDSAISDTGAIVTIQNSSDSINGFQIQNAAGTSNLFIADTTNTRIGIGKTSPGYTLDVNGDINSATGLRVGGNLVCDSSGCTSGSGSGFYIQNGTSLQTSANFNIQSAAAGSVGGVIKGAVGQTADLFDLVQGATTVIKFTPTGNVDITGVYKVNGTQITSADLGDNSNIAHLNGTQAFTGNNTFSGTILQQNAADSVAAFRIQNAAGTSNLFVADTTNTRIGIGTPTPGYTLDVNGDINIPTGAAFRINGVAICGVAPTCAPSSGSTYYIQNSTAQQTNANFNIMSANGSSVGGIIRGNSGGQTADLLRLQDATGANVAVFSNSGALSLGQNLAATGTISFKHTSVTGSTTLTLANPGTNNYTLTLPAETGTLCSTGSVCAGYAASSGSGNYIQNGTTIQTAANFAIQSAAAGSIGAVVRGATSQSANLQEWQSDTGTAVAYVSPIGDFVINHTGNNNLTIQSSNSGSASLQFGVAGTGPKLISDPVNGALAFYLSNAEKARFTAAGVFQINSTGTAGTVEKFRINTPTTVDNSAASILSTGATTSKGLVIQAAASQTANLQEWQTSTGAVMGSFGPSGALTLQNTSDSTAAVSVANAAGSKVLTVDTTNQRATVNQLSAPGTVTPTRLDAPATPTVTPTGTTGAVSYSYKVVALMSTGFLTAPSSAGSTATGNATLTSGNYNAVSWSAVSGASAYYVYRTSSSGSPSTTGLIGYTTSTSLNDTGLTATQASPLSSNLSNGTTYYYKVTAIDGLGGETTTSTEASQAINASNQAIVLTWTAIPGARSYRVYRGTSSGAQTAYYVTSTNSFTDIYAIGSFTTGTTPTANNAYATVFSNGANAQLTIGNSGTPTGQLYLGGNLPPLVSISNAGTPGSIYYSYQVVPLNSAGSIMAGPYGGAGTSTGNAILDGTNYNTVSWAATSGAASYNIYRIVVGSGGSPTSLGLIGNTASTTFNDTGLAGGGSGTWPVNGAISTDASSIPSNIIPQGRYAYAVSSAAGSFKAYDISNPSNPTMVGAVALNNASGSQVTINGRYAYVLENGGKQFEVIDIANPAKPVSAAVVSYRDSNFNSITSQGRYLYLSGDIDLRIYDITNPTVPAIVASTGGGGSSSYPVAAGRYVFYLGGNAQTLGAYDVASPTSPVSVGTVSLGAAGNMLRVSGRYAYVLIPSTKTMKVIDISNPASMAVIATVSTTGQPKGLAVTGRYAYVTPYVNGNTGMNTVEVFDVSNPAVPVRVSSYATGTNTGGGSMTTYLATQGRYLYVALGAGNGSGGLQVIDMGGEYAQNFEAGAAQADTLSVTSAANFNGGASIGGGLQVTGDTSVTGDLGVSGAARFQGAVQLAGGIQGGVSITGLTTPSAPTVLPQGTSGATAYSYQVVAVAANGGTTPTSASGSTATGNATLSTTNYNNITWTPVAGALSYRIYRVSSGGTPSSTGLIGTTGGNVLNDTGLAGDSSSAPTTDISGSVILGSNAAASGVLRLANGAGIAWRNAAGTADKVIKLSSNNTTDGLDMPGQLVVGGSDSTAGAISFFSTQVKIGRTGNSGFYVNTGIQTFEVLNSSKNSAVGIGAASDFTNGTVEKLRVGTVTTVDNAAYATFGATAAANKALVIQGAASQSANLQEWQNSAGTALLSVTAAGAIQGATSGGAVAINGGTAAASGVGGAITLQAADGGATSGAGGAVTINTGAGGGGNSAGGAFTLQTGAGGAGSAAGGAINISSGAGGTTFGNGGAINLTAGNGTANNTSGGAIAITAGTSVGNQAGGALTITAGGAAGAAGGTLTLKGGTSTGSTGGNVVIQGGTTASGVGGGITLTAANGVGNTGGAISLTTGSATSVNVAGGALSLTTGAGFGNAAGGAISLQAGAAGAGSAAGAAVSITAGTGATTSGTGGAVNILSGNAVSGAAGNVNIDVGTSTSGNGSILIGNAARAQTITIGNTTGATGVSLQAGSGNLNLGNAAVSNTINLGATAANVTQSINIGNNSGGSSVTNVTIGSGIGSGSISIQNGTGGLLLGTTNGVAQTIQIGANSNSAQTILVGASTGGSSAVTVEVGSPNGTSSLKLSAGTGGINIGNDGAANTIQIGNASSVSAQTINLGTNSGGTPTTTVNIGSLVGASVTNIRAGSGIINLSTTQADATTVAQFTNAGATTCTVQPGGTGFACSSDARLKTNVATVVNPLDIVRQLRGVTFNWTSDPNGQTHSGFIAQELEQLIPSAVSTDSRGYKVANYSEIIPYLVGTAQAQDLQLTGLQQVQTSLQQTQADTSTTLTTVGDRVTTLEQKVAALEAAQPQGNNSNFTDLNVSGTAIVQNLTVTGSATIATLTVSGDATFTGNILVNGHIIGNPDTRGTVTVPAGQTQFTYTFTKPYDPGSQPNVILTPKNTFAPSYRVDATPDGFTVYFQTPATTDTIMNYQVQQ